MSANGTQVVAADFNNDGRLDLAGSLIGVNGNAPGSLAILLGNGDGTFTPVPGTVTLGASPKVFAAAISTATARMDLLETMRWGPRSCLGTGMERCYAIAIYRIERRGVFADFNGDSFPDVIADGGYTTLASRLLLGNGDGHSARLDSRL